MARTKPQKRPRRVASYSEEFKQEAVQMLLDGHSAASVAERLGLSGPNVLYRWKKRVSARAGPAARTLGDRVAPARRRTAARRAGTGHPKKSVGHLKPAARSRHVCPHRTTHPPRCLSSGCRLRRRSRSAAPVTTPGSPKPQSARDQRDRELMPLVCDIFWQHKRRYGARRIAVELQAQGQPCGVDRVAKLLKIQGLQAIQPQSFKPKTTEQSAHAWLQSQPPSEDAAADQRINRVWVADITYIPLQRQLPSPIWPWCSISARAASSAGVWPST